MSSTEAPISINLKTAGGTQITLRAVTLGYTTSQVHLHVNVELWFLSMEKHRQLANHTKHSMTQQQVLVGTGQKFQQNYVLSQSSLSTL